MRTLASLFDVPTTDPESVLTESGIAERETDTIRVPRAKRMRLRFIEMLLNNLINVTSFDSANTILGGKNTGLGAPHRIRASGNALQVKWARQTGSCGSIP
jgi:hypothetical protein